MIGHQEFASAHFNRPGVGKWRRHLSARQIQFLRPTGLFEVFSAFGYEDQFTDGSLGELEASNPVQFYLASRSPMIRSRPQYLGLVGTFNPEELTASTPHRRGVYVASWAPHLGRQRSHLAL